MAKDYDNIEDEIVYIAIKDESNDEGDNMELISHVSKMIHGSKIVDVYTM